MVDGDDHMFVVTPRKVLFISQEVETNQVISNQNYDIVDSGKDDTGTTNSMFTTGRKKLYTHSKDFGTLTHSAQYTWTAAQDWTETTGYTPVVERIIKVTRDGVEIFAESDSGSNTVSSSFLSNTFRLNDDNTVQFWNEDDASNHAYVMIYEYTYTYRKADFATFGGSSLVWSTTQHKQDSTSITTNGVYHRNFHVPQLASGFDVASFNTNYIADFKDINTRQRVITSSLVNSLTVGQKVRYTDSTGTTDKVVRSIEYSYPQTLTVIELGEYMFSGFDVEKQTIDSLRSLDSSVSITKY